MAKAFINKFFGIAALMSGVAAASEEGQHGLTTDAPILWDIDLPFWPGHSLPISGSLIMFCAAALLITIVLRLATRRMQRIPSGLQNFVEWAIETLYNFVEGLTGKHLAKRYFWYFATIFLLIITSNYMGLIPGVGSITYEGRPLLRGANADLNIAIFLGFSYSLFWIIWVLREQGLVKFYHHTFGAKGGLSGALKYIVMPIFFFVGLIEILSICIRPVALAARLFGNIFAGESIVEQMAAIHFTAAIPFITLELIVGFVQALVFLMLTAIFLKTQVGDDDDEEHA